MLQQLLIHEKKLWQQSLNFIAGTDEVGRGCLAGPVVAAAVILPCKQKLLKNLEKVNDSKKLSHKQREELFPVIQEIAVDYGIGIISEKIIDQVNILQASFLAMKMALENLKSKIEFVLVDGNKKIPDLKFNQSAIIKGDSSSLSIAAASILAKVTRDEIMLKMSEKYGGYYFEKHKGYPTKQHFEAIQKYGLTDIHRLTFCKNVLLAQLEISF
jgi:ribonuclease HII